MNLTDLALLTLAFAIVYAIAKLIYCMREIELMKKVKKVVASNAGYAKTEKSSVKRK